jgi:hypothetical protein
MAEIAARVSTALLRGQASTDHEQVLMAILRTISGSAACMKNTG